MANLIQIKKRLDQLGLTYRIIDLGAEIFRVEDVVKAGVNPDEIVKTLLVRAVVKRGLEFKTEYFAFAIRGKDRLNFKKVKRMFGPKAELAKPEVVQKVVRVPVGAVCPIGIEVPVYFDKGVLALTNVNLGSGDLTKGLDMKLADLLKAVGEYRVVDLV